MHEQSDRKAACFALSTCVSPSRVASFLFALLAWRRTFHALCDNKGPTFVLVRVGPYIFGGFASSSWNANNTRSVMIMDAADTPRQVNPSPHFIPAWLTWPWCGMGGPPRSFGTGRCFLFSVNHDCRLPYQPANRETACCLFANADTISFGGPDLSFKVAL